MKKSLLLLLASMFVFAGCANAESYYPEKGGQYVKPFDDGGGGGGEEGDDELKCTYRFFFSFSATTKYNPYSDKDEDAPILEFTHAMLKPLGQVPDEVKTEQQVIDLGAKLGFSVDPAFPKYLGFSFNGVCLDETGLWNFETDYKQQAVVNLYAIWVSE